MPLNWYQCVITHPLNCPIQPNRFKMSQKSQLLTALTQHFGQESDLPTQLYQSFADPQNPAQWYLVGTDGCHLCDDAYALLTAHAPRLTLPNIFYLDVLAIYDNYDKKLAEYLSSFIPILITPSDFLCYPFGIMDILALKQS